MSRLRKALGICGIVAGTTIGSFGAAYAIGAEGADLRRGNNAPVTADAGVADVTNIDAGVAAPVQSAVDAGVPAVDVGSGKGLAPSYECFSSYLGGYRSLMAYPKSGYCLSICIKTLALWLWAVLHGEIGHGSWREKCGRCRVLQKDICFSISAIFFCIPITA